METTPPIQVDTISSTAAMDTEVFPPPPAERAPYDFNQNDNVFAMYQPTFLVCSPYTSPVVTPPGKVSIYSYNPYANRPQDSKIFHDEDGKVMPRKNSPRLPAGTLHVSLLGKVSFVAYPEDAFRGQPATIPKDQMVRVFIGQLPYQVTDMQLEWLCYTFGRGGAVYFPERIMKNDSSRGGKVPTGCVHCWCDPDVMSNLIFGMHKRILVDDTGVWYAQDPNETEFLNVYMYNMKMDPGLRYRNRPYDAVVVQLATSNFLAPFLPLKQQHKRRGKRNNIKSKEKNVDVLSLQLIDAPVEE